MEDNLKLPVGTDIQLQMNTVDNNIARYTVKLLGYLPGKGIIASSLENNGRTVILKDGTKLISRVVLGTRAIGFRTSIITTNMVPYPHIHLSYPQSLEISEVRNASRAIVKEASLVRNLGEKDAKFSEALVNDLSTTGAKLLTKKPLAVVGDIVEIKMLLTANKIEHKINLMAEVKKVNYVGNNPDKQKKPMFSYGVMFKGINAQQSLAIYAYVLEQTL